MTHAAHCTYVQDGITAHCDCSDRYVWVTATRGTNDSEYQIYVANMQSLGWQVKTFDEWLDS